MIVCHCHAVRAEEIRSEVRLGAETVEVLSARCGATSRCGGCLPAVEAIMRDETLRADDAVGARS